MYVLRETLANILGAELVVLIRIYVQGIEVERRVEHDALECLDSGNSYVREARLEILVGDI